jgi:DNA (cytosine-5)-methyltransferase 1
VAILLRIKDPQFFRKRSTGAPVRTIDLDAEPAPTIMATGIRSVGLDKYHLEDDGRPFVSDPTKPPYRVPSMSEVAAIAPNGFSVISTFAGCGGSSLGYRMAGFKVLWASEFIHAARTVYEANAAPGTNVDGRDIREVDPLAVLKTLGLKPGDLDVLDGSPPCASFSTAGKRAAHWGEAKKYSDKTQRTDDLFFEFVRFVRAMQPKVFVAENVSGLVKGVAKGYFLNILAAMKSCGYRVEARLLDAQWLGVPQARQRIIFVGVREDLGLAPAHPEPLPYRYSVREAIPWIVAQRTNLQGKAKWKGSDEPSPTIGSEIPKDDPRLSLFSNGVIETRIVGGNYASKNSRGKNVPIDGPLPTVFAGVHGGGPHQFYIESETSIEGTAIGRAYDSLNPGKYHPKYKQLIRVDANEPSPTVSAQHGPKGVASNVHPTEKRKFSIAELKRICAFPDDFVLSGTYAQQWERLGRAVPPVMMFWIASTVRDKILVPNRGQQCAVPLASGSGRRSRREARKNAGRGLAGLATDMGYLTPEGKQNAPMPSRSKRNSVAP